MRTPDVLVLGGGGILGEAWMSAVLAGLDEAEGFDARGCASYVGGPARGGVAAAPPAGWPAPRPRRWRRWCSRRRRAVGRSSAGRCFAASDPALGRSMS